MRHRRSRKHRPRLDLAPRSIARCTVLGATFLTLGCTGWAGVPVNALPSPSATVRVQLRDGTTVIVQDAVVRADSIVGVRSGSMPPVLVAVALTQVERVEVAEIDRSKTAKVIVGVAILGLAAVAVAFVWGWSHVHT